MSDVRRRRHKSDQSVASDDLSEGFDELNVTKETVSSEPTEDHHDSEYDTADSDAESDGSQDGTQRESGDGQEEDKPAKKLDDDEDRRNPQYIPKRGTFYEHDDRMTEEVTEDTAEPPAERDNKEKKVWKDKNDRWDHDRYNDEEQAPKSHEELIAVYGYDIRNEEGPPRARRRRRYGRGPNKYTRNWEDENAYGKPVSNIAKKVNRRSKKNGEEFPALNKDSSETVEEPVISSAWYSNKNKTLNKLQSFPPLQNQQDNQMIKQIVVDNVHTNENKAPNDSTNIPLWKKDMRFNNSTSIVNKSNSVDTIKSIQPKAIYGSKRNVQESVSLAASRSRGRGYRPNLSSPELKSKGRGIGSTVNSGEIRKNITQHDEDLLINDIKHINLNDYHHNGRQQNNFYSQSPSQQRSSTSPSQVPMSNSQQHQPPPPSQPQSQQSQYQQQQNHSQPSADVAGNRPKRYSSLRQRPAITEVPGQTYPTQHGQHTFYPQGGNSHNVLDSQGFAQNHFEPTTAVPSSAAPLPAPPVIPLSSTGQPPTYAPPPFLVPTPQFISQTAPPNIFVPAPNGPTFPPNFQGYQGYNPTPQGPPPPELYQPQGCTYYNPAQQPQPQQQVAPNRRPKAIPILRPPDNNMQQPPLQPQLQQQLQLQQQHFINETSSTLEMNDPPIQSEEFDNQNEFPATDVQSPVVVEPEVNPESIEAEPVLNEVPDESTGVSDEVIPQEKTEETIVVAPTETIERHGEVENIENSSEETPSAEPQVIIDNKDDILVVNDVEIETKPIIDNKDLTKVENIVHENPMVEEATA